MGEQAEKFCLGSGGSIRLDARCPQVQCDGVTKKRWGVGPEGKDSAKTNCVQATTQGPLKILCEATSLTVDFKVAGMLGRERAGLSASDRCQTSVLSDAQSMPQ